MTAKTAKKTVAKKAAPAKKTAAKTVAKKAPAKKTAAKKTAAKPKGEWGVKVIQTIDERPGRDSTVYFTDGTRAVVKRGSKLAQMLSQSESHAPALLEVSVDHGQITSAKPVNTHEKG